MLLKNAEYIPSPFCDDRPPKITIDLLVIHNISLPPGKFETGEVQNLFTGDLNPASDPFFETLIGLTIVFTVPVGTRPLNLTLSFFFIKLVGLSTLF